MRLLALVLLATAASVAVTAQTDGHLFDQGRDLTDRSPRADATLDAMKPILGAWDVTVTTYPTDSTTHVAEGQAEITYMNRGYAYQERRYVPASTPDGLDDHVLSFLLFSPSVGQWGLGEGRSSTEHITLHNGTLMDDALVLTGAERRLGGTLLTRERVIYTMDGTDAFEVRVEWSTDNGATWTSAETRTYARRDSPPALLATRDDYGQPAPGLPDESRQFDFLIGTWDAQHQILLGGNWIQFPTTFTAVHTMGGHAVLEHSWFDLDPNLPDAATTILRLYNRAERRWESLYLANRANTLLHFGGNWEGDRMVLHTFGVRLSDTISRFVFHDIKADHYAWFADTSTDRGQTFNQTWTIDVTRREVDE